MAERWLGARTMLDEADNMAGMNRLLCAIRGASANSAKVGDPQGVGPGVITIQKELHRLREAGRVRRRNELMGDIGWEKAQHVVVRFDTPSMMSVPKGEGARLPRRNDGAELAYDPKGVRPAIGAEQHGRVESTVLVEERRQLYHLGTPIHQL